MACKKCRRGIYRIAYFDGWMLTSRHTYVYSIGMAMLLKINCFRDSAVSIFNRNNQRREIYKAKNNVRTKRRKKTTMEGDTTEKTMQDARTESTTRKYETPEENTAEKRCDRCLGMVSFHVYYCTSIMG